MEQDEERRPSRADTCALVNEPRLWSDLGLVAALHAELGARSSGTEAVRGLFQLGALHGLRDGLRALERTGLEQQALLRVPPAAPALSIRLEPRGRGVARGEIHLAGRWDGGFECRARMLGDGTAARPGCHLSEGYTSGWYSGLLGRDLFALETACAAAGSDVCRFELRDARRRAGLEPAAALRVDELDYPALRRLLALEPPFRGVAAGPPAPGTRHQVGPEPVVHLWGPVMVMPFHGVDEAMRALDLLGRDAAARRVSVVVVDLRGTELDEAFGAAALEHVLAAIDGWGAEAVLAGASPLSERVVREIARDERIVEKDLPQAIATAFQIASARWRTV